MIWYWIVFLSLMVCSFLEQFTHLGKKKAKRICLVYMSFFVFMSTIRWEQDLGDWHGYYSIFNWENITSVGQIFCISYWPFEPLYYLVMRVIKYTTDNFTILMFFMAIVANGCFYIAAVYINDQVEINGKIFGDTQSTIITTYFAFWATSCANIFTVRTNMAVAICLISIKFIEQRKWWKFVILIMIACMFHFVSLVFLVAYPIYLKKINIKQVMNIFLVACGVQAIGLENIIQLVGILGGRYAEKVSSYNINKSSDSYTYLNYSGIFLIIRAMANTILILAICLYIKKYIKNNLRFRGFFNLYIVGAFIQALTIGYNLEFARIAIFYTNIQFFILPYIFKISKSCKSNKYLYFLGYSSFMSVKMYSLLHSAPGYVNFLTIFG